MIKALWLCNIVLPEFSQEFNIKRSNFGGWITGMLHGLSSTREVDISLCFPIRDVNRLRDGVCNGHAYYSFLCDMSSVECKAEMVEAFEKILDQSKPDIVHIWGTEYVHTLAMLKACEKRELLDRTVINIQGLVSIYARHYMSGIPESYVRLKDVNGISINSGRLDFEKRGMNEVESIKLAKYVIGRTDWDRACAEAINPDVNYHSCGEILRDIFYDNIGVWNHEDCQKHRIFVSQAPYPIKGFHYLLRALPIVVRKYPDTVVYVASTDILGAENLTAYARYLKDLINEHGLEKHVTFIGSINEQQMLEQYRMANVFVSASTIENSSNSVCEAMLVGTPVVASYVGGMGNIVSDKKTGFLYPCEDVEMLAYYIGQIFDNRMDVCAKFSKEAVHRMKEICSLDKNVRDTLTAYVKVID